MRMEFNSVQPYFGLKKPSLQDAKNKARDAKQGIQESFKHPTTRKNIRKGVVVTTILGTGAIAATGGSIVPLLVAAGVINANRWGFTGFVGKHAKQGIGGIKQAFERVQDKLKK